MLLLLIGGMLPFATAALAPMEPTGNTDRRPVISSGQSTAETPPRASNKLPESTEISSPLSLESQSLMAQEVATCVSAQAQNSAITCSSMKEESTLSSEEGAQPSYLVSGFTALKNQQPIHYQLLGVNDQAEVIRAGTPKLFTLGQAFQSPGSTAVPPGTDPFAGFDASLTANSFNGEVLSFDTVYLPDRLTPPEKLLGFKLEVVSWTGHEPPHFSVPSSSAAGTPDSAPPIQK